MLRLDAVGYRYPGSTQDALRDVSLDLPDGEVVGVVGANGAGKSTLCLIASGLAPRVVGGTLSGRVLLDSVDLAGARMHDLVASIGLAFQNPATQLSGVATTVYEEVAFGPSNLGVPLPELIERTSAALDAVGVAALADRDPSRLSGGERQLIALAGLLAMRPRHLVLDEPTAQLDPAGARLVSDALERLSRSGIAILIAEHRTELLARICSRLIALDAGTVAIEGPAEDVLRDDRLASLGVAEPPQQRMARLALTAGVPTGRLTPEALA